MFANRVGILAVIALLWFSYVTALVVAGRTRAIVLRFSLLGASSLLYILAYFLTSAWVITDVLNVQRWDDWNGDGPIFMLGVALSGALWAGLYLKGSERRTALLFALATAGVALLMAAITFKTGIWFGGSF